MCYIYNYSIIWWGFFTISIALFVIPILMILTWENILPEWTPETVMIALVILTPLGYWFFSIPHP